ncbi:UDP-N-acetylglucosamine transporter [Salpingoeca rosetta]|uniref:UDP-N-acetylglucosamine transporter n=1 Tax=Salpingoeca rosetta (strain ATCC 50818 / BSB-021) TaxID=946362 RepID=F2U0T9_SALR5|nr:UDP-N-acetylglucosamine transporter [Salpingoeca rosetta]EGD80513.1 UDP-N-acetylglucosamine transporter [Salpingoeca rosetta]|eukprot:XP_004997074.1 UDP-N-acetylglucosamine transporter [Salpingoeca rosetta]
MPASDPSICGIPIKYASLVILVVQNSALYLMLRASRARGDNETLYLPGTAVVLAESFKLLSSLLLIAIQEGGPIGMLRRLHTDIIGQPITTLKIMVPAGLYTLQNTLQYMAVTYLDAATFQVTYQLKVLTTALFAVVLLGKRLSLMQWISLVMLTAGVALIQMPDSETEDEHSIAERFMGLIMVVTACFSSGFAGVYFEKVLKGETAGVWVLNVQLAGMGVIIALSSVLYSHYDRVMKQGFLYGYNKEAYIAISLQAFGGLIVAVVVKYADNILKGFATSISIILSSIVSALYLDFVVTSRFGFGALLVIASTYVYGTFAPAKPTKTIPITKITTGSK